MGQFSNLVKHEAHMQVCLQGSNALESGKYWQTTHSCCSHTKLLSMTNFSCGASLSSYVNALPVAKYSCYKVQKNIKTNHINKGITRFLDIFRNNTSRCIRETIIRLKNVLMA